MGDVKYQSEDNNNVPVAKKRQLFPKKAEVDLSFENLTYTVSTINQYKLGKCQWGFPKLILSYILNCNYYAQC